MSHWVTSLEGSTVLISKIFFVRIHHGLHCCLQTRGREPVGQTLRMADVSSRLGVWYCAVSAVPLSARPGVVPVYRVHKNSLVYMVSLSTTEWMVLFKAVLYCRNITNNVSWISLIHLTLQVTLRLCHFLLPIYLGLDTSYIVPHRVRESRNIRASHIM